MDEFDIKLDENFDLNISEEEILDNCSTEKLLKALNKKSKIKVDVINPNKGYNISQSPEPRFVIIVQLS